MAEYLSDPWGEDDWEDLLHDIHAGRVVPVIGPELVTLKSEPGGDDVPLFRALAPALAEKLGLPNPQDYTSWNAVARQYLLRGNPRKRIYYRLAELLDKLQDAEPPEALKSLATIQDFSLYVCSTPDPLMARALSIRPGFSLDRNVLCFDPTDARQDLPLDSVGPMLLHILGNRNSKEFAVWEEDYIEYICALLERAQALPRLFDTLKQQNLLLLGAPSEDWIVRFLLRVARQERISDSSRQRSIYLADHVDRLGDPLVFFLKNAQKATHVIDSSPARFVEELALRWNHKYSQQGQNHLGAVGIEGLIRGLPDRMVHGSVFISYSHDDLHVAFPLLQALHARGVPIWLDKRRLHGGDNFERELEHAIKHECSFFVSLISQATERDSTRFVHRERRWAAERHVDGYGFYLPVILDLPAGHAPQLEPERVNRVQRFQSGLDANEVLAGKLRGWIDEHRRGLRPRN